MNTLLAASIAIASFIGGVVLGSTLARDSIDTAVDSPWDGAHSAVVRPAWVDEIESELRRSTDELTRYARPSAAAPSEEPSQDGSGADPEIVIERRDAAADGEWPEVQAALGRIEQKIGLVGRLVAPVDHELKSLGKPVPRRTDRIHELVGLQNQSRAKVDQLYLGRVPAQVVEELGTPDDAYSSGPSLIWDYVLDSERTFRVEFTQGYLSEIGLAPRND